MRKRIKHRRPIPPTYRGRRPQYEISHQELSMKVLEHYNHFGMTRYSSTYSTVPTKAIPLAPRLRLNAWAVSMPAVVKK